MPETKISSLVAILAVTMTGQIGIASNWPIRGQARSQQATIAQVYVPPNRKAPDATVGGASRGGCLETSETLRSLTPANNLALTTQEYPTLYWYIPQSNAKQLEFELRNDNNDRSDKKTFELPNTPGVVSLNLQKTGLPPLKVGQTYHWYLRMVCEGEDRSGDVIVEGWIERTQPSQTLVADIKKALPNDLPTVYAQAGIWQDSVALLAELRRTNPNDSSLAIQWERLLKSVELDAVADKPLVDCCTATK